MVEKYLRLPFHSSFVDVRVFFSVSFVSFVLSVSISISSSFLGWFVKVSLFVFDLSLDPDLDCSLVVSSIFLFVFFVFLER